MKIDAFPHILPKRSFDRMFDHAGGEAVYMRKRVSAIPVLYDLDERFRVMDRFGDYRQVLTIASPPIETLGPPAVTAALAALANDELADLLRPVSGSVPRIRGVGIAGRSRGRAPRDRARLRVTRCARHPDLHQRQRPPPGRGSLRSGVREDGRARPGDLGPPRAGRHPP